MAVLCAAVAASAQCTPNQLYADSVYGVWPDTTQNFPPGNVGVFYTDTLNLLVPEDAGLINEAFAGFVIDSVALEDIAGLPDGLSVACNSQTGAPCTFLPSQVGCGLIEGTPTTEGTHEMTVNVLAYTTFFGNVIPVPQSFTGYRIVVGPDNVGINALSAVNGKLRNTPNPFVDRTTIEFSLPRAAAARVRVYSLVGEQVWSTTVQGKQGMNSVHFDAGSLESGAYLYKVESAGRSWTNRMVINR